MVPFFERTNQSHQFFQKMNKNYSFVFLKKNQRLEDSNFDLLNQTNESIKIQKKTFFKNFEKRNFKEFAKILKKFKISEFQKFHQKKNFFYFLFGKQYFSKQSLIICMCKKFIEKQVFLNQTIQNPFFEILNNFYLLKNLQKFFLKVQFFSKVFQKKKNTVLQIINIQKLQKKFFEKKNIERLVFCEFFKNSKNSFKTFQEQFFSNTIFVSPKFKFFIFFFFLEIQFSIFSNLKNLKKIQKKNFFQISSKNFAKSFSMMQFFEKNQNRNVFFHDQNSILKSQNKRKEHKSYEINVPKKEKNFFKKQKLSKKIFFFVFSWVFALVSKNVQISNLFMEKLPNFQIEKKNSLKNLEQPYFYKKNLFLIKQKNKQKNSFFSSQSFDYRIKYSKIHALNSLNIFKNIVQLFDSFLSFIPMNSSEHWNHFLIIYHQYLKFDFFNIQMQLQKNQFWFTNFFSFQISEKNFFYFSSFFSFFLQSKKKQQNQKKEEKVCFLSDLAFLHLIPQNFQKPFGFFTEQNLQIFQQKSFQKTFSSFFLNSVQKEKKRVDYLTLLKSSHFEKSYFHLSQFIHTKKFKKNFLYYFVFFLKKNCLTLQKFSFLNSNFENFLEKPIFLLWKRYFSNFLFFNSTLLFFFKNSFFLKKIGAPLGNFLFLKNSFSSIFLKKNTEQKEILKEKFFAFFTKPFYQKILQTQKEKRNIFYDQNIFWLISKKFIFFPTKIQKLELFHFSPIFSGFLMLHKKSIALFLSQTSQTKSFLSFVHFPQKKVMSLVSVFKKNQRRTHVSLRKKNYMQKKNKNLFSSFFLLRFFSKKKKRCKKKEQKIVKTNLFFEHKNQQMHLLHQKKFEKIFFQNSSFQKLNFDCFSVSLRLNHKKQLKYFYNFEKKPTYENIQNHLNECKQILKKSIGQKQLNFMKKLHKKIQNWSKKHNTSSSQKIFEYCDSTLLKFLWNWARKTHPNKSKGWIRKKYFHLIYSHKWFFGKKIGKIFICLPLHSQTKLKK